MSIFGFFLVTSLLREAGWPRKQGIFGAEAYDTAIADSAIDQMVDWGAAIGAGRPRLALQMIAEMLRDRDWESADAPDVKVFIDSVQGSWSAALSPRDAVQPIRLAEHFGRSIRLKDFKDSRLRAALEQHLLEALLWGLSNPNRFEVWYASTAAHRESMLPEMRRAGPNAEQLPTLPQFLEDSAQILRDYEREIGPLPSIPPRLLADAQALGWKFKD